MANMLNNYFSEIGQKLAANIEVTNSANIRSSTSFITQRCTSFYLQPITESDILKHIMQLNPSKSTGPDGIPGCPTKKFIFKIFVTQKLVKIKQ